MLLNEETIIKDIHQQLEHGGMNGVDVDEELDDDRTQIGRPVCKKTQSTKLRERGFELN